MQNEVLFGARLSAAAKALFPVIFSLVLLLSRDDKLDGTVLLLVLCAIVFGLWQARGAFRPKQLLLDREGLVFQPPFSSKNTRIKWPQVTSFEIKGSDKAKKLVCQYVNSPNGPVQSLNLGDGWSTEGKDLFADKLEKVRDYLEAVRKRQQLTTQSAAVSAQRVLVEVVSKPAPQSQTKSKPQADAAPSRSGQVYAGKGIEVRPSPVSLSGRPEALSSKTAGWGLLTVGATVGMFSAYSFIGACRKGMCGQGFWDVPDPRLWGFFAIWIACAWAVWGGLKKLSR